MPRRLAAGAAAPDAAPAGSSAPTALALPRRSPAPLRLPSQADARQQPVRRERPDGAPRNDFFNDPRNDPRSDRQARARAPFEPGPRPSPHRDTRHGQPAGDVGQGSPHRPAPEATRRPQPDSRGAHRPTRRSDLDEPPEHAPGSMRLSKRMSELGIASRREADAWIESGWVRVDDHVVSELGSRVVPGQRITVDAKAKHQQAQRVTVLINKPVGIVSGQAEDGYEPAVVLVKPENQWRDDRSGIRFLREHLKSLVPAGRLDIDSVGLLVLTQDGRVAKQLVGDDSEIEKEYLVRVAFGVETKGRSLRGARSLPETSLALLRHGLELDGEPLRPAQVEWVNDDQLRFVLRQGKKRQIRRMCEAVGLQVLGLKRVRIGGVMLGDLPSGQWRYLRSDEGFLAP